MKYAVSLSIWRINAEGIPEDPEHYFAQTFDDAIRPYSEKDKDHLIDELLEQLDLLSPPYIDDTQPDQADSA